MQKNMTRIGNVDIERRERLRPAVRTCFYQTQSLEHRTITRARYIALFVERFGSDINYLLNVAYLYRKIILIRYILTLVDPVYSYYLPRE